MLIPWLKSLSWTKPVLWLDQGNPGWNDAAELSVINILLSLSPVSSTGQAF